jgi:hypothetical protein
MRFTPHAITFLFVTTAGAFSWTQHRSIPIGTRGYEQAQKRRERDLQLLLASSFDIDVSPATTATVALSNNPYQRDENWLENATNGILDTKLLPLGSLNSDDVESIIGLMMAWARRQSLESALIVEYLLKRVIDDMKAGNRSIYPTTRLYTIVSRVSTIVDK